MNQFIKTNDKIINLKNVSNINVLDTRIVFNMNYSIEIRDKVISDYTYWDFDTREELEVIVDILRTSSFIETTFIGYNNAFVNINEISSIKYADRKNRIIFNLSHPVSFNNHNGQSITSEFVYFNYTDIEEYQDKKTEINTLLGV